MPVAKHTIVFARIVPSELNIVTTENNNIIDLALVPQIKTNAASPSDIWQNRVMQSATSGGATTDTVLMWNDFVDHFYGGGEKDFGISQVAGRQLTMIGVSGEYANGVPQGYSALTHLSDRGQTDAGISGISILNDVIDSVVYDLGLPHEAWDSCSYMNVVEQLGEVHTLGDCTRVSGKLQQSCSLSMAQLVHEIASNFDENTGVLANSTSSAVYQLYNQGLDTAVELAMNFTNANNDLDALHDMCLSVMFKNSTPGVRNVEFRIHFLVGLHGNTLVNLCANTMQSNLSLTGTQV